MANKLRGIPRVNKTYPSKEEFEKYFRCDSGAGILYHLRRPPSAFRRLKDWSAFNTRYAEKAAGTTDENGYTKVKVGEDFYYAHRVIWIMSGRALGPDEELDHILGTENGNGIGNLRISDRAKSAKNRRRNRTRTACAHGVLVRGNKFYARIRHNRKAYYLGTYTTIERAAQAVRDFLIEQGFSDRHGT